MRAGPGATAMFVGVFAVLWGCDPNREENAVADAAGEPSPAAPSAATPVALTLADIRARGEIVVLSRNAPTTWYEERDEVAGPEFELITSFAGFLGVGARIESLQGIAQILDAVRANEGDLAAAGLTRTDTREQQYIFGPDYQTIQQQVVCRRGGAAPQEPKDLIGLNVAVIAASSYVETLERWQAELPDLQWVEVAEAGTEQLLEAVWLREYDCALADSNIVAVNRRYLPELNVAFPASDEESLAWVVAPESAALLPALDEWFIEAGNSGLLAEIQERYYGHLPQFDYVDVNVFRRRIDERLPELMQHFESAAETAGLDWTILAAMAYQESHWDPLARSPANARGIMMLTRSAAAEVGVKDRHDPEQSIHGGAEYLRRILDRIPESVTGDERLWFALVAYNVGYGHLLDARALAERLKRDPDRWTDIKDTLPLLSREKYYKDLKHGYARGSEPVRYVDRVRDFRDMLEQFGEQVAIK